MTMIRAELEPEKIAGGVMVWPAVRQRRHARMRACNAAS
jgi:hypothetical protein